LIESVFYADVVDERLSGVLRILACAHLSAYDYADAIAPEALGKTETIVGGCSAGGACSLLHAQRKVDALEGFAGDVRDLALQEGVQRVLC